MLLCGVFSFFNGGARATDAAAGFRVDPLDTTLGLIIERAEAVDDVALFPLFIDLLGLALGWENGQLELATQRKFCNEKVFTKFTAMNFYLLICQVLQRRWR